MSGWPRLRLRLKLGLKLRLRPGLGKLSGRLLAEARKQTRHFSRLCPPARRLRNSKPNRFGGDDDDDGDDLARIDMSREGQANISLSNCFLLARSPELLLLLAQFESAEGRALSLDAIHLTADARKCRVVAAAAANTHSNFSLLHLAARKLAGCSAAAAIRWMFVVVLRHTICCRTSSKDIFGVDLTNQLSDFKLVRSRRNFAIRRLR